MINLSKALVIAALAAGFPLAALAAPMSGKLPKRITVHPRHWHGYGYLPGYNPLANNLDWHGRSVRAEAPYEWRYWRYGELQYGYGRPGFYRGRWNGGGFGPCWTQTPIGPMWNCDR